MTDRSKTYVVGASGYVGSAVLGRLAPGDHDVVGTHHSSPSAGTVQYDFWSDEPTFDGDVVFAATVETDDAPMEAFERRATALADACSDRRFVYLSSDAVFGGDRGSYSEEAQTDPATHYGRRTARFEEIVRETCADYCIVRPSYVYGFSGGVLDDRLSRTFRALRSGERVTYYEDMYKSPVEVNQLAEVVRRVHDGQTRGTLHVGGPRTSVYQFHRQGASAFGADADSVEPDQMPAESPHPRDTSLDTSRLERERGLRPGGVVESLTGGPEEVLDA